MHITFATLTKVYRNRGNVIHVTEVCRNWQRQGVQVTLIASGEPIFELPNVNTTNAGLVKGPGPLRIISFMLLVIRIVRHVWRLRQQSDILYFRDAPLGWCFALLKPLLKLPLVYEVNGLEADEKRMSSSFMIRIAGFFAQRAEKASACKADAVICVTEGLRNIIIQKYSLPAQRVTTVSNGVNLQLFAPPATPIQLQQQNKLRKKLNLTPNDAVIVYVGSLQPWQDLPTVIRAMEQLKLSNKTPVLIIVGDGVQRNILEQQAAQLPASVRIIFTGEVPYNDVPIYISLANVCTLPRTEEVNARIGLSPIKLYAYLACGKPVVTTQIAGLEFIGQHKLGQLVPCGDAPAFADALQYYLQMSADQHSQLCQRIRNYATQHCGWEQTARQTLNVCNNVLPQSPHA